MDYYNKVIVALDNMSVPMADEIMDRYKDEVYGFKVNHTVFPYIRRKYMNNLFCDYKLFDIPSTMCSVIEHLIGAGAKMVTIHMSNNRESIKELSQYSEDIKLLGVTMLTSWDHNDSYYVYQQSIDSLYKRSIQMMEQYGFWVMICSPKDLMLLKDTKLKKICPGIRKKGQLSHDQIRVSTPEEAINNGADYLVMGRSFFNNDN